VGRRILPSTSIRARELGGGAHNDPLHAHGRVLLEPTANIPTTHAGLCSPAIFTA